MLRKKNMYILIANILRLRQCIVTAPSLSKSSSKLEQQSSYAILNARSCNLLIFLIGGYRSLKVLFIFSRQSQFFQSFFTTPDDILYSYKYPGQALENLINVQDSNMALSKLYCYTSLVYYWFCMLCKTSKVKIVSLVWKCILLLLFSIFRKFQSLDLVVYSSKCAMF